MTENIALKDYEFFKYFADNHNLTLLESEMDDIKHFVCEYTEKEKTELVNIISELENKVFKLKNGQMAMARYIKRIKEEKEKIIQIQLKNGWVGDRSYYEYKNKVSNLKEENFKFKQENDNLKADNQGLKQQLEATLTKDIESAAKFMADNLIEKVKCSNCDKLEKQLINTENALNLANALNIQTQSRAIRYKEALEIIASVGCKCSKDLCDKVVEIKHKCPNKSCDNVIAEQALEAKQCQEIV